MAEMRFLNVGIDVWINPRQIVRVRHISRSGDYELDMADGRAHVILAKDAARLLPNMRGDRTKKSTET